HADSAWAGEAVEDDLASAGEDAGGELLGYRLHPHRLILIDPGAGLDVDLLSRLEGDLEDVAVAVQPQDALGAGAAEGVDEEARSGEHDVGDALHALEAVVEGCGGGEPLVFAHVDALAL